MKRAYTVLTSILILPAIMFSQRVAKDAIFINGGTNGTPGTTEVVSLDLETYETTVFDKPMTGSVQALVIDGDFAYVSVDDSLIKYDLTTKTRVAAVNHKIDYTSADGLGKSLTVVGDKLFFSKQYPAASDFVDVILKSDLSFVQSIAGMSTEAASTVVIGDTAYIAAPGAWNATEGNIDVVLLSDLTVKRTISLGSNGQSVASLCTDGSKIYGIAPSVTNWTTGDVSKGRILTIDPIANTVSKSADIDTVGPTSGYYSSAPDFIGFYKGILYFRNEGQIGSYNTTSGVIEKITSIATQLQATAYNEVDGYFVASYGGGSDANSNFGHIFDMDGTATIDFDGVKASPEQMAIYYTGKDIASKATSSVEQSLHAFPNPCSDVLHISTDEASVVIANNAGVILIQAYGNAIDISSLTAGIYTVSIQTADATVTQQIIKE